MTDTIYRQAAIDALNQIESLETEADREYAAEVFEMLPSAQPEIITCKDCKHGMYDVMCKFYWCHGVAHSANWFCADAEGRTDDSF